jgi:Zn-dependent peptidase ImmA (M78 family)/transcriptional regulator with XRE-family HTH domain
MKNKNFLGEKLRLARLLNGFTQQELGGKVCATRQYIHQLESDKFPSRDVLAALCEVLKVHESFFYTPLNNDVKFEQCHFRKRKTTPVNLANRVCAYSTIFEQLINYINKYLELPSPNFLTPKSDSVNFQNIEIEKIAEKYRDHWDLGVNTPIKNMTRTLETAGVVITSFSGVSEKVDALSLNRKYPIIIRNEAKDSPCRLRFDLAHECGHFALHDGIETGDTITESEADKFASAFLFPRSSFVKEFPRNFMPFKETSWRPIYKLKQRWGMSLKAIVYRAHYLKIISAQQYRAANIRLSKTGQTKKENYDATVPFEEPELLKKSLDMIETQVGISFAEIAYKLSIYPKMLSIITGIQSWDKASNNKVKPFF